MAVIRQVRRLADLVDRIQVPANGGFWPGAPYSRPPLSSIVTAGSPSGGMTVPVTGRVKTLLDRLTMAKSLAKTVSTG